jgi:hypothetical protein
LRSAQCTSRPERPRAAAFASWDVAPQLGHTIDTGGTGCFIRAILTTGR